MQQYLSSWRSLLPRGAVLGVPGDVYSQEVTHEPGRSRSPLRRRSSGVVSLDVPYYDSMFHTPSSWITLRAGGYPTGAALEDSTGDDDLWGLTAYSA